MKALFITAIASLALLTTSCMENKSEKNKAELEAIFPKGELAPAENFTGNAWNTALVANDSTYNTVIGNVYFEPGARSNWHIHPAGQILLPWKVGVAIVLRPLKPRYSSTTLAPGAFDFTDPIPLSLPLVVSYNQLFDHCKYRGIVEMTGVTIRNREFV